MKYNLRNIPSFETLKAFKFSPRHWRIIDCVPRGGATDPYHRAIGPLFHTLWELTEYAMGWYEGQYP